MTGLSIMRLVPGNGRITSGRVLFEGSDVLRMDSRELRRREGAGWVRQVSGSRRDPARRTQSAPDRSEKH
jgi:ABC-type glutathione transport system ATPase component